MDDHISTEVNRILKIGSEESVVHNQESFLFLANLCDTSNVTDFKGGISGSFCPNKLSVGFHALANNIKITEIYEINLNSLSFIENASHISLSATIHIINAEDVVS